MATNSNVFSQGGGGTAFENEVQTAFFISFLLGLNVPATKGIVEYYRLQSGSIGYNTDDLLLGLTTEGVQSRILIQIKHNLTISAKGTEFTKVIIDAWKDFKNPDLFNSANDKQFIIKYGLTSDERNHLKVLLDWARAKSDPKDFFNEVARIKAKEHYLMMFKVILKDKNNYTDDDLFRFLKTIYFFEFDFGTDNSIVKSNYLSLITRYKVNDQLSADQIWDSARNFVADYDYKGGQLRVENIPDEFNQSIFKTAAQTSLRNLKLLSQQNFEAIELVNDEIGGYNLSRLDTITYINEAFYENRFLVISGDPGCGKSAVAKTYVRNLRNELDGFILCFNAEELSNGHLRDYFNKHNIDVTLKELFGFFAMFRKNIIYIDAAEKLLEANGTPFTELLTTLKTLPNVRMLISCRSSSLGLIEFKFFSGLTISKLPLSPLNEAELGEIVVAVPLLQNLMENQRLKKLLSYPKYLDFAYRALAQTQNDFSDIDEERFREQLWLIIIENRLNEYHNGLPERRGQIFIDVAVARSKQMRPYAPIASTDYEAIDKLLKDNVLIKSGSEKLYAPAHDVLEDWALVRFVHHLYGQQLAPSTFFEGLGNEPAMRRAYRLWVQSSLKPGNEGPLDFATSYLFETSDTSFWKDESLIGILYSDQCHIFFDRFSEKLKKDNFGPLFRLIQVMRTACRENFGDFYQKNYVPRGYGWQEVFRLISENISVIDKEHYELLYQIIKDWSTLISFQEELPLATRDAGLILLFLLNNHIDVENRHDRQADEAVEILCSLAGGLTGEFIELLNEPDPENSDDEDNTDEDDDGNEDIWYSDKLKARVVKIALHGPHSKQIAKFLPNELIKLARKHWLLTTEKVFFPTNEQERFLFGMSRHRSMEFNHHFGLKHEYNLSYSPGSAYQTPVLSLLNYHPKITIYFIVELINWCTENYRYSDFSKDDEVKDIELELEDGTKILQFGSSYLWSIYRSTDRVSPNLMQSVLMALERYLMNELKAGGEAIDTVNELIDHIYRLSTSVATTGLIASVCQAYPAYTGKQIIPLLSTRKLISWDVQRYSRDRIHTHFSMFEPLFDNERVESDKLPHRVLYYGGLRGFFPLYCYEYGTYNERIFAIIDRHRQEAADNDFEWKKILDELDIRTWRVTKRTRSGESVTMRVEPTYDESIQDFVKALKEEADVINENDGYRSWLWSVKKQEVKPKIEEWRKIFEYYSKIEQFDFIQHQPGQLASIGVTSFWGELTSVERDWCLKTIERIIYSKIRRAYNPYDMNLDTSAVDFDAVLDVFPLMLGFEDLPDRDLFESIAYQFLTAPFQENDPDTMHFFLSIGKNLWPANEPLAIKLLKGLLFFAGFNKKNRLRALGQNAEQEKDKYWKSYEKLVTKATGKGHQIKVDKLNFDDYSIYYISRAIRTLPYETANDLPFKLITKIYHIYIPLILNEERREAGDENRDFSHQLGSVLQDRISKMILWNDHEKGKLLFVDVLSEGQRIMRALVEAQSHKMIDVYRFFQRTIEGIILEADRNLPETDESISKKTSQRFTAAWRVFAAFMAKPDSVLLFSELLLLDIDVRWRGDASDWKPLNEAIDFYEAVLRHFGLPRLNSAIVLLSHIGDETLLFRNLKWLITVLRNPKLGIDLKQYQSLEQLMIRVYQNHLSKLLANRDLFEDYLWLLDRLIAQQSSDAYWIREFLFSFQNTTTNQP